MYIYIFLQFELFRSFYRKNTKKALLPVTGASKLVNKESSREPCLGMLKLPSHENSALLYCCNPAKVGWRVAAAD